MVWNIPLVSWGQLSQLCPLPTSCAHPASLLVRWCEKQKSPWLSVSTAQRKEKHPCVINIVFSTNPKHNPIQANMEKLTIPVKTSTVRLIFCLKQAFQSLLLLSHTVERKEIFFPVRLSTSSVYIRLMVTTFYLTTNNLELLSLCLNTFNLPGFLWTSSSIRAPSFVYEISQKPAPV